MSKLDDALREALRREEPPEGFAERVLAKVEVRRVKAGWWAALLEAFRSPRLEFAAALACIVLLVGGFEYARWRDERIRGERAKQEYMLALRIAGGKLQAARAQVMRVSHSLRD